MTKRALWPIAAISVVLLLTQASGEGPRPTHQLAVYDADGKRVGPLAGEIVLGTVPVPMVAFELDQNPFMLFIYRDGLDGASQVGWESDDCSGLPFLEATYSNAHSTLPFVGVGVPGSTVYVQTGPPQTVSIGSVSSDVFQTPSEPAWLPRRCIPIGASPHWTVGAPARPLEDMDAHFTPPFTVH